jgi:LacI family transcriptional regulator
VVLGHVPDPDVSWVLPDGYDGSRQATEHLIRLGHRNILILCGDGTANYTVKAPFLWQVSYDRFQGYKDALEAAQIPFDHELLINCEFTTLGGFLATRNALRDGKQFTAIYAITDELAAGAIAAIEDAGLRVPTDISVVGYDDLPEVGESFTTVHQDISALADHTVDLVLEALEAKPVRHINMPVHLVVRGTTAAPNPQMTNPKVTSTKRR